MPEPFSDSDADRDGVLTVRELEASHGRAEDRLPNLAIPELNGVGAQEIFVTAAHGLADFISAMDTDRIREWNAWYHLMNAGLRVKASGETDFPCMSGTRVGQGRSYVLLGKPTRVDYAQWVDGIARGRSYVSDGYAHALAFSVGGSRPGDELQLAAPGKVAVSARVAFSSETPRDPAYGSIIPLGGLRDVGDTVVKHEPLEPEPMYRAGAAARRSGGQRARRRTPQSTGRWPRARYRICDSPGGKQLGGAATVSAAAHESRLCSRRRQADPCLARQCAVGACLHRSVVARPFAPDRRR